MKYCLYRSVVDAEEAELLADGDKACTPDKARAFCNINHICIYMDCTLYIPDSVIRTGVINKIVGVMNKHCYILDTDMVLGHWQLLNKVNI